MKLTQHYQFLSKYSRWNGERRETYNESVKRTCEYLYRATKQGTGYKMDSYEFSTLFGAMQDQTAFPSLRLFQMAGPAAERCNVGIYNCLSRLTRFITRNGVRSFADFQDGDTTVVLTAEGNWRAATVRCYGIDRLYNIRIGRGRTQYEIQATRNHRWLLKGGTVTTHLEKGDVLDLPPMPFTSWKYEDATPVERLYWAYGFVYGDGTKIKNGNGDYAYSMVRLCGEKAGYADRFREIGFSTNYGTSLNGDCIVYTGSYLKTLPNTTDSIELLTAFVRGYLDADGQKQTSETSCNPFVSIQSSNPDAVEFIRNVFPMVGVYVTREEDLTGTTTNYGTRPETIRFGLLSGSGTTPNSYFRVLDITEDGKEEYVWCLEVEGDQSFVLPGGLPTGNCAFRAVDTLSAFSEILYVLMQGTGCGFSVEHQYISKLPNIEQRGFAGPDWGIYTINDTTEGWCSALKLGLISWFNGQDVEFNYSRIRPKGSRLVTKGGTASGPEPLQRLLEFCRAKISQHWHYGGRLTAIDVHDICCLIGDIVRVGGVRRAAMLSLSDLHNPVMRDAKIGKFWQFAPWRSMANNSAAYWERPNWNVFKTEWEALRDSGTGERGFCNLLGYDATKPVRRTLPIAGTNPCGEIVGPNPFLCNLSTAIARPGDTWETLAEKVGIAAIFGTLQSALTQFGYLPDSWRHNAEAERLLGVDITGQMDCEILRPDYPYRHSWLAELRGLVIDTNREWAAKLGINPSVATTCVKPGGNGPQLFGCSSGLHPRYAPFYIRRFEAPLGDPLTSLMIESGVSFIPKPTDPFGTVLLEFPVASPAGCITRNDLSAIDQFNNYLVWKRYWCEHNASVTIYVGNPKHGGQAEWDELAKAVYESWDHIGGVSFLPFSDHVYEAAPYEEIDELEYQRRMASLPEVDFSLLPGYEKEDHTTVGQELACSGDKCDI